MFVGGHLHNLDKNTVNTMLRFSNYMPDYLSFHHKGFVFPVHDGTEKDSYIFRTFIYFRIK